MFKKILIANRGEIAMRILRTCQEMGVKAVVAYSEADKNSLPVQFSEENICIGPGRAKDSYLNQRALLQAAKAYHCDAIHPGYGFLSENAKFAHICQREGITFIGPSATMIRRMGDKQAARTLMRKCGVPVVPGSNGLVKDAKEAAKIAEKIGYPVLLKATAGGGGRGMRTAYSDQEIESAFESASAEAAAAFGDGSMYLEKLIRSPRHIEVQIMGDSKGHIVHLGERDCSMQRRNQKLIEEAPASTISPRLRAAICRDALKAARAVRYSSVGTVEFILDENNNYYFIEMNTRIQVEHTVTEAVTGIDLIREQIRIAAGLPLSVKQSDVHIQGHAIECRINAEDPENNFAPQPGIIPFIHFPGGGGVRVESALYTGAEISPYYDSMVAKLIVHAPGRLQAIRKMRVALQEMTVQGVKTNTDFLYLIMFNRDYILGNTNTAFLEKYTDGILKWQSESRKLV